MRLLKLKTLSWVLGGIVAGIVWRGNLQAPPGTPTSRPTGAVPAEVSYIAFSHRRHTDLGMACGACHFSAYVETRAGLPTLELCRLCHRSVEAPPVSWEPATRLASHVFFSHRRHATVGNLSCERCHEAVPTSEPSFPRGMTGMNRCVACHRVLGASTDCLSCHR
jgi:hypothetical protein